MGLYTVEKKHIEQLDSGQLLRVLKKLLEFEAKEHRIPQSGINIPLNENDPDGGVDGWIEWDEGPARTEWIPNRLTGFQSKAMKMPANKCQGEVENREGKIKSEIRKVLDAGGSYVFFCHQAYTPANIEGKIKKVVTTLRRKGCTKTKKGQIHFYDGNRISNWVNQYFPVQVHVMEMLGRNIISGIQTWGKWNEKFGDNKYHTTDKLDGWMNEIRRTIAQERKNAIRITGLSGLGKTRLALEAFRPPDDKTNIEQAGISDSVVYYQADSEEDSIIKFVTEYRTRTNTTFVIDECSSKLHAKLADDVSSADSNINLITICNEPDHSQSTDTKRVLLAPEDFKSVVKDILNDTYSKNLPDQDISRIADFAGGFPAIAVKLAEARLKGGTRLELDDEVLVGKILWGQGDEDPKKMTILQACSIFNQFRLERNDGAIDKQAKFICDIVAIDDDVKGKYDYFCRIIKEFAKREIIQKHGRYFRIEPVPLALKLAKSWYESAMSGKIRKVIEGVESNGLLESFCEQSKRFDCIPEAADLIEELCGPNCPFGNAEVVLSVAGSRIFRSFAEVNPKPVTDCLLRVLTLPEVKTIDIANSVRRNLVWTLERLCWHEETFTKAANMLRILALSENERWSNNSTGLFLQLFHIRLPGTKANLTQRQEIIDSMISGGAIEEKKLAVQAIKHAFQVGHFSRGGGVEAQGTKAPERDYYPTGKEVEEYWNRNLELLTNLIISGGVVADEGKTAFASISGSLIRHGYISDIEKSVEIILQTGIFWHAMLVKIENLLIREDNRFDDEVIERLKALSSSLEPQTWPDKIRHYVSIPDWLHRKDKDGHYINLSNEKAEQLADALSESDELWDLLPLIYEGEQRQGFTFGERLASKFKDVSRFTKQSVVVLDKCQRPDISALNGFLSGLDDKVVFMQVLSELAKSEKLVRYVPALFQRGGATKEHLDFILKLLKEHKLTMSDLGVLRCGSPLEALRPKEAMTFCGDLASLGATGAGQALEILYMYCFGTPMRFEQCRDQFTDIMSKNDLLSNDTDTLDIHTWSELVKKYIPKSPASFSEHICKELLVFCSSDISDKLSSLTNLKDVARELLKHMYEIVWPYFGDAMLEKNNWELAFGVTHLLEVGCGDTKKTEESPLVQMPYDYLKSWCQQNVPEGPAAIMMLLPVVWEESADYYGIDELSRKVLIDFGIHKKVRDAASRRIFSFTSWGSREPYYLRRINVLNELRKAAQSRSLETWIDIITTGLKRDAQESKTEHDEFRAGILDR